MKNWVSFRLEIFKCNLNLMHGIETSKRTWDILYLKI